MGAKQVKWLALGSGLGVALAVVLMLLSQTGAALAVSLLLAACATGCLVAVYRREKQREALAAEDFARFAAADLTQDPLLRQLQDTVLRHIRNNERQQSRAILDKQAQISTLQSQINPHFLYNTLESIRGQALVEGNKEIAAMAEALGAFFRYNISQKGLVVTLREELANVNNYFTIQKYRFENQFAFRVEADSSDDAMEAYIPKLTLQPVIENAIYHGLETKGEAGGVTVEVVVTEQRLLITVRDDGVGMEDAALAALRTRIANPYVEQQAGRETGNGIALVNVNRRLKLLFGEEYGLQVYSTPGLGTDVEMRMPLLHTKPELEVERYPQ